MVLVMKSLEILTLPFQSRITWEPLPPIELFVIGVVKAFNDAIAPRFADGDENGGNPVIEAQPDHQSHRARIAVAASKT